jgi:hypothetical protein
LNLKQRNAPLVLLLAAFAAVAYGTALNMPFIGDDYVFLDEIRDARFVSLWSFGHTYAGWYRPWSREFHFWLLHGVAGFHTVAYRAFGMVLWLVALGLFAEIVRRLAGPKVAIIATAGAASMALWGTPLLWISGSQDLWMLAFSMASFYLLLLGRDRWAVLPFGLALLSKETSAVLPGLMMAYLVLVERARLSVAIRRTAALWVLVALWLVVHPTLRSRLMSGVPMTRELELRPSLPVILLRTILAPLNLDMIPHPVDLTAGFAIRVLVSALILVAGLVFLLRSGSGAGNATADPVRRRTVMRFAAAWMAIGWLPLFLPSIAWHAYYGCLGALGMWLALALSLESRPRIAVAVIACLAIVRGAQASTPSWDWGNEWYQRRAGNMLSSIQGDLIREHPSLPHHSRIFLGHIPNNIGLIAGQSPALRVWYADSTLKADYYSSYRPRASSEAAGPDYFFRFDTLQGMVEVKTGNEDVQAAVLSNPEWEGDHERLAMTFLRSGDTPRAAAEFEKLSSLPNRADAAVYAAVCLEVMADSVRADSLLSAAQARLGLSSDRMRQWVERLRTTFPGR